MLLQEFRKLVVRKLGLGYCVQYAAVYNTKNEDFIDGIKTKIYQTLRWLPTHYRRHSNANSHMAVTNLSPKIHYVFSLYLKIETMAKNLFKIYLSVTETPQSRFRASCPQ
jgi:hypothetical protein